MTAAAKPRSKSDPNLRKIHRLIAKWAKRLELYNWEFKITVAEKDDPEIAGAVASSDWKPTLRYAEITLRRDLVEGPELEETIIHELLHVALEGHMNPDPVEDVMYERMLDTLAEKLKGGR